MITTFEISGILYNYTKHNFARNGWVHLFKKESFLYNILSYFRNFNRREPAPSIGFTPGLVLNFHKFPSRMRNTWSSIKIGWPLPKLGHWCKKLVYKKFIILLIVAYFEENCNIYLRCMQSRNQYKK